MPQTAVAYEVIEAAVQLACRAPSYHNSQPWRWVADGSTLDLHLERDRLVTTDRSGREALISCGAVLDHLRVAMAAAGWTANVDYFPNPNKTTHLATVDFSAMPFVTDGHRHRADAILQRRTDRLPFAPVPDWAALEDLLRRALDDDGAVMDVLRDDARPQLAEASQLTESLRLYDSSYHQELSWWTSPFDVTDGIPQSALVSAAESDRVDVGRTFPVTRHAERRLEVPEDRSTIVALSAVADDHGDILRCGEALSALLLEATLAGMATCTLTHLTEVAASRDIVSGLIGRPYPQALIRIGLAPSLDEIPPPTPRRPLSDVLKFSLRDDRGRL
ncbi:putative NAD(P)H nitroreductase acg [Mycobacterium antarcticum]|uniref:Acg family FMN-binding oxidoreductase n=1 Tax=unclassified Mycolicibacterium TaxID=2636767 RepID=UPI0023A162AC|nr:MULTISPECIES: NAD(P)H nitroreductase [unclassified Mycolicibacterium]BDX33594.1 putative NAD(P)H nitroreductase acg [Mycolicibacterium sp. TUM20985]GLP82793.1 putative NAD(P)H nitroreductase acg [Mycolicibacterium sp. TUM20984]